VSIMRNGRARQAGETIYNTRSHKLRFP